MADSYSGLPRTNHRSCWRRSLCQQSHHQSMMTWCRRREKALRGKNFIQSGSDGFQCR